MNLRAACAGVIAVFVASSFGAVLTAQEDNLVPNSSFENSSLKKLKGLWSIGGVL